MPKSASRDAAGPGPAVKTISDTARWVAVYRAAESERPDSLFKDPYARLLAGEHGERIVRAIPGGSIFVGWTIVVRTRVIDDIIMAALAATGDEKIDGVLNLAAGLDTRPYRLALPPELKWYEVDLPEILAYKEEMLSSHLPRCKLRRLTVDLFDEGARRGLFDRVAAECKRVLVLTEGILMYLPPDKVDAITRDLAARAPYAIWVQDYAAKRLLQALNLAWAGTLGRGGSRFEFMNGEGRAFFTSRGWREREFRPFVTEADRLDRRMTPGPLGKLASAAARLSPFGLARGTSGILVLERPL